MSDRPISYDDVLELLEEIESETLDDCSKEEIQQINQLLAFLAEQGILPHETGQTIAALQFDINALINPALLYENYNAFLCKSWIKKSWDHTRHFVKHHKKEILIGAAIVVAVAVTVTVVVATCGATSGSAATVASGIAGLVNNNENVPSKVIEPPQSPLLQEIVEDKISSFKENLSESIGSGDIEIVAVDHPSFVQHTKNLGSYLAHETLDFIANQLEEVPKLLEETQNLFEKVGYSIPQGEGHPIQLLTPQTFAKQIFSGHQIIDKTFGTDLADSYISERKEGVSQPQMTYGVLPPPGMLKTTGGVLSEGRLLATQCNSTWGWKVGQSIQNKTWWGSKPKWSTVRQRYWKNKAAEVKLDPNHPYKDSIIRMEKGLAPQIINRKTGKLESVELHH